MVENFKDFNIFKEGIRLAEENYLAIEQQNISELKPISGYILAEVYLDGGQFINSQNQVLKNLNDLKKNPINKFISKNYYIIASLNARVNNELMVGYYMR